MFYVKLIFSFILTAKLFILCSSVGVLDHCDEYCDQQRIQLHQDGRENISDTTEQNKTFTDCNNKCKNHYNISEYLRLKGMKKPTYLNSQEPLYKYLNLAKYLDKNKFESGNDSSQEQLKNVTPIKYEANGILVEHSNNVNDQQINKTDPVNLTETNMIMPLIQLEDYYLKDNETVNLKKHPAILSMKLAENASFSHNNEFISREEFNHYIRAIFGKHLGENLIDFLSTYRDKN